MNHENNTALIFISNKMRKHRPCKDLSTYCVQLLQNRLSENHTGLTIINAHNFIDGANRPNHILNLVQENQGKAGRWLIVLDEILTTELTPSDIKTITAHPKNFVTFTCGLEDIGFY